MRRRKRTRRLVLLTGCGILVGLTTGATAPARSPAVVVAAPVVVHDVSLHARVARITPVVLRNTGRAELAGGLLTVGLLVRCVKRRRLI